MTKDTPDNRIRQPVIAFAAAFCFVAVFALRHDFWFEINDDVLMKDILSGVYTGMPDGHNIQMLYPLGLVLALLYRVLPAVSWYACFLVAAQALCLALVLYRIGNAARMALCLLICVPLLGPHTVLYQYSVTCAILSGTAAFYLLTGEGRNNDILALLLSWLAYLVRSEMMLLTLPMLCIAFLFRLRHTADKRNGIRVFVALVMGLVAIQAGNLLGYGTDDWKTFTRLFDNRTELYDFQTIPEYDGHAAFYETIGLSKEEHALLINYNYGLCESIDAEKMGMIAEYARNISDTEDKRTIDIKNVFRLYLYRLYHPGFPAAFGSPQSDAPWNLITIACYLIICILFYGSGSLWEPALLFACRTVLWGYIMMRGREPVRITHGMYIVEILLLAGMIQRVRSGITERKKRAVYTIAIVMAIISCAFLPSTARLTKEECTRFERTKQRFDALYAYMDDHPDSFYFMDVYSWVPYTEKLSDPVAKRPANRDIMGGWACKSPVYGAKLRTFGFSSMQEALLDEGVYYVQETGKDTTWLTAFYKSAGTDVVLTREAEIESGFTIYRVRRA